MERLALELQARGHAVSVLCGTFEPKTTVTTARRIQNGIPIFTIHRDDLYFDRWEKTFHPGVSREVGAIMREVAPDVVHVHQFIRLSRDLVHQARLCNIPAVFTLHDFVTTCLIGFRAPDAGRNFCDIIPNYKDCVECASTVSPGVPLAPPAEFELLRKDFLNELRLARARCAISETQREKLAKYHQLPADFFHVVPLAPVVDLPAGAPAPEPPPLRIATWGMQMERKGAHVLIEAVRECRGIVELDIFGRFDNNNYEMRCRERARGFPIRFHGRFEWDELIATPLHAAVFPSLTFETFGLTFDESWALGHPVIATDLGAYSERANDATILFPAGDVTILRDTLLSLVRDTGRLARLRAAVRPPARFSDYVSAMENIYHSAIAAGAPPAAEDHFDTSAHPDIQQFAIRETEFRRQLGGA